MGETAKGISDMKTPRADAHRPAGHGEADASVSSDPTCVRLYRIVPPARAELAFRDANSAKAGRWTSAETPVVYASLSPACALLEFLAHLDDDTVDQLHLAVASVPASLVQDLQERPENWHLRPYRRHVQAVGDAWAQSCSSPVLRVPSALSPFEHNALVNTRHPELEQVRLLSHERIVIDSRLIRYFSARPAPRRTSS